MRILLIVFLGGGLGTLARYFLIKEIGQNVQSPFPWGTFLVNISGCFLIGLILGWTEKHIGFPDYWKLFLVTGFCGGFTTFSTFAYENKQLMENKEVLYFILYTTLSVGLGLIATVLGSYLVKKLI